MNTNSPVYEVLFAEEETMVYRGAVEEDVVELVDRFMVVSCDDDGLW